MTQVRRALVVVAVALAVGAFSVYGRYPWTGWLWLPDMLVGPAALGLASANWRTSMVTSTAALVVAVSWWAGTLWPVALY